MIKNNNNNYIYIYIYMYICFLLSGRGHNSHSEGQRRLVKDMWAKGTDHII